MGKKDLLDGKRILIVDDEPDVLDTLAELLPMCRVTKASSFDEAKEVLDSQYFNMAILDIMGVDGYELLEIAKKKDVIAVMLTAHALSPEDTVKSYEGGGGLLCAQRGDGQHYHLLKRYSGSQRGGQELLVALA